MDPIKEGDLVRVQYPLVGGLTTYEPSFRLRRVNRSRKRFVLETPLPVEFRADGRGPDGLRIHPADLRRLPELGSRQPTDEELLEALDEHPMSPSRVRLRIKSRVLLRGCKDALRRLAQEGKIREIPWRPDSARPGFQYAPAVRTLYRGFSIHSVSRSGTISSKGGGRGRVGEVVVCS